MFIDSNRLIWLGIIISLTLGIGFALILWPRLRGYIPKPVAHEPVLTDGSYRNIIFLHHSVGSNLIAQGNVRALLNDLGYQFWDHGYNSHGLLRPDGSSANASYRIPGNRGRGDTDVAALAALFAQPVSSPPENAFSRLLQHEVIVIKSCFPNSAVKNNEMEMLFKDSYLTIRETVDQHPERLFILLTTPPLHPLTTNSEEAIHARAIATWLASDEFSEGRANLAVFDLFNELADPNTNMLRLAYQIDPNKPDSHPNQLANETIGPRLVTFIDQSIKHYVNKKSP
jgi:hypothetical protein